MMLITTISIDMERDIIYKYPKLLLMHKDLL